MSLWRMIGKGILFSWLVIILFSCQGPFSKDYYAFYNYRTDFPDTCDDMEETDYFLIILVDARHLDYTDNRSFFCTVAKHPSDGSKNGDVGHAWIYLQGWKDGRKVILEGGHSGERGAIQAKYFDGIMNYMEWGYANPIEEQKNHPRYEPNPVKYLWAVQKDGFFQKGSGGHVPTFAAKIDLTSEQFHRILDFVRYQYCYKQYALTGQQCSTFVGQVAALANFDLDYQVTMLIQPYVWYGGLWIRLWECPQYSSITFASPDRIEKSLVEAVQEGRAQYALNWYLKKAFNKKLSSCGVGL